MNVARKNLISKICAMLVIIALTMSDFLFIGQTAVSYAIDTIKTNSSNVDFSAYFLDSNGEKAEKLEENIDKGEEYLFVDISVKNEGYFNGKISLNNNNFNIKNEILSENIVEIVGNEVKLNQINAGSNITIKLAIEPINNTSITKNMLNDVTKVVLNGQYVNSKNVEKDKFVDILGTAEVSINWKSSENTQLELDSSLLTNAIYGTENEENRVVQILVNSKITNNNYPVRNTNITLNVPEKVKNVNVHSRSNAATNSSVKFSDANYIYNKEENKLTITVANENEDNISWIKNVQDSFVITYVLDKEESVLNSEISVNAEINTYDDKKLSSTNNVHIDKEIDGIVSFELNTQEESIYKGKIYTGEERNYITTNKIYIDYINANKTTLNANEASFASESEKISANIVYKQLRINKNEFLEIFGNEGYITIKDGEGIIVSNISEKTEADSNGNIVVNLAEGKKNLTIETSKPVAIGTFNIESTKSILSSGYSRDTINSFTSIVETIVGNYDEKQNLSLNKNIELKNTSSKAELTVSTNTLSSIEENKEVKITAVLLNNDESKDLYQNPTVKIKLPDQVKAVNNAKCKVLYANGLELSNARVNEENGNKVIEINLAGVQNAYNTETLEGTTIIIYADLIVDELAINKDDEIIMTYSNEIATSFADNGEIRIPVKIAAEQGVITTNNIKALSVETMGNKESQEVLFDIASEEKDLTVDISTINNEDSAIENVEILGTFPTNSNLGTKLTSGISITSNTTSAKIYYSDKENATKDLNDSSNNWVLNGDINTAKSYLIVIDNMQVGERFTANYTIKVPANLNYNLNASEGYTVEYTKAINSENKTAKATTLNLTTGTGAEISADLKAYVGGEELKDGDTVYSGEVVKYSLTIKNTGSEKASEIKSGFNIPEGTSVVKYTHGIDNPVASEDGKEWLPSRDYYEIIQSIESKSFELNPGEDTTLSFDLKIEDSASINTINQKANISYIGKAETTNAVNIESNGISNKIEKSIITAELLMIERPGDVINANTHYAYDLIVKNDSNREISNIQAEINSKEMTIESVYYNEEILLPNNRFNINSLKPNEERTYSIEVLTATKETKGEISVKIDGKYHSNVVSDTIKKLGVNVSLSSDTEGETIQNGDKISYNINIVNNSGKELNNFEVTQKISSYLDIDKVIVDQEEVTVNKNYYIDEQTEKDKQYLIGFIYDKSIKDGETLDIKVDALSDEETIHEDNIQLASEAEVHLQRETVLSEQINHILAANYVEETTEEDIPQEEQNDEEIDDIDDIDGDIEDNNNEEQNNNDEEILDNNSNNKEEKKYTISGTAWFDENQDGKRDSNEKTLSGISIKLLNLDNNQVANATTSENGFYSISNVSNGKYVAIFEYDTEKYVLTKYQVETATESRNSDVENVNMNIDGENKRVSSTDTLVINNSSLTNIDIGLLEAKIFDLSLSKTILNVKVSNENGTSNKDYNDANLAKVEVKAKYLNSTTAVIEYKIKVTNNGELAGYARKIADYKPADLTFNSKLNPDWYQSGDSLYSTTLANTKIEPGESKELTLVLTKTMTETNTGLTNNTAEIVESYNSMGIEDTDSIPGNKQAKEDDLGSANIIISVSTGAAVSYVSLTLSIIAIIAVGAYIATRKILKENIKI